jgi:hypothetical protein
MDDTTDVAAWCLEPPHGHICQGNWTFTKAEQLDFLNATLEHLEGALGSMDARGKTAIVSSKAREHTEPLNSSVFDALLLRHGSLHFIESFSASEVDVQTALQITAAGTPFMVHATQPNETIAAFSQREYCLAGFLIVAGEHSYWGMGDGWGVNNFPWYPEFDRPLGKPLAAAEQRGGGQYFRAFEHLNVTLDTTKKTAAIRWHGLGPVPTPPAPPAPAPPTPAPPGKPIGSYTALRSDWIVHQNPPSYSLRKAISCTNQTSDGCAEEAAEACNATAGCASFSVLSPALNGKVGAELGPLPLKQGVGSAWWSSWQKAQATPGAWKPTASAKAGDDREMPK